MTASVRGTLREVVRRAGVGFVVASTATALAVTAYAFSVSSVLQRRYLHMVVGLVWIGTNLLVGLVVRPTLDRMDDRSRVAFYSHFIPKLTVLLPLLLLTTVGVGLPLARQMGLFPHAAPWLALTALAVLPALFIAFGWRFHAWTDPRWLAPFAAVALAALAAVAATIHRFAPTTTGMTLTLLVGSLIILNGLGLVLSGNLRLCLETRADHPDPAVISSLGHQTTTLARLQLFLQFIIIVSVL